MVNIYPPMESVESGQSVQFNCSATGVGSSNFAYQWFLNREYIWSGSVFYIDAVSVNKTGNYTCYVMSPYGGIGQSEQAILILEGNYIDIYTIQHTYTVFTRSVLPSSYRALSWIYY